MATKNKNLLARIKNGWGIPVAALLIAAAAGGGWNYWHDRSSNSPASTVGPKDTAAASVIPPKKPAAAGGLTQGGATDKSGQAPSPSTSSSQWVTSQSGLITLQQPVNDSSLKSGDYIFGTAKVSKVNYRLIDDKVGKIAEGELSVVKGKFSGVIKFTPRASRGELDVFSYSSLGAEVNEVQVTVNF